MRNLTQIKVENKILSLVSELENSLLPQDVQNICDFIKYNEFGVGFETLCTQLFEYDSPISAEIYSRIESVGKEIGYSENHWNYLKALIKND